MLHFMEYQKISISCTNTVQCYSCVLREAESLLNNSICATYVTSLKTRLLQPQDLGK